MHRNSYLRYEPAKAFEDEKASGLYIEGEHLAKLGDTRSYGKGKGNKANT